MPPIHRDLLAIIFGYGDGARRERLSLISRNSRKICRSYHYIISIGYESIWKLLMPFVNNGKSDLVKISLQNPRLFTTNLISNFDYILNRCAELGHTEIMRLFLAEPKLDEKIRNNNDIVSMSASNGHLALIKLLLGDPRINPCDVPIFNRINGMTPIMLAVQKGHLACVKLFLSDPRFLTPEMRDSFSIYHLLVLAGHSNQLEIIKYLLSDECPIPIEIFEKYKDYPINNNNYNYHQMGFYYLIGGAVYDGHMDILQYLLSHPKINIDLSGHNNYILQNSRRDDTTRLLLAIPAIRNSLTPDQLIKYQPYFSSE